MDEERSVARHVIINYLIFVFLLLLLFFSIFILIVLEESLVLRLLGRRSRPLSAVLTLAAALTHPTEEARIISAALIPSVLIVA